MAIGVFCVGVRTRMITLGCVRLVSATCLNAMQAFAPWRTYRLTGRLSVKALIHPGSGLDPSPMREDSLHPVPRTRPGAALYAKRLERGKFIWSAASAGAVSISAAQMAYMLDGIDWRNPQQTWRPQSAG